MQFLLIAPSLSSLLKNYERFIFIILYVNVFIANQTWFVIFAFYICLINIEFGLWHEIRTSAQNGETPVFIIEPQGVFFQPKVFRKFSYNGWFINCSDWYFVATFWACFFSWKTFCSISGNTIPKRPSLRLPFLSYNVAWSSLVISDWIFLLSLSNPSDFEEWFSIK